MRTFWTLTALLIILTFGFVACGPPSSGQTVQVASNMPMSGELAIYGQAFQKGLIFATEELAKNGQTKAKMQFDWGDNAGSPQAAVTILQRQLLESPAIYTSALKPQTMAITDRLSELGIPHFAWILDIKANPHSTNNFRTWVSLKLESDAFLAYAKTRTIHRAAIVFINTPAASEEINTVIVPGLKAMGADVFVQQLDLSATDFSSVAVKIRDYRPDFLLLNGFISHLVGEVRALRPYGLIKDGNTLAVIDMLDAAKVLGHDETEGIVVAAPPYLLYPDREPLKSWRVRFRARFNEEPAYHSAYAYDMGIVINDAAGRLHLPANSTEWIKALRSTDAPGITGQLRFDDDGSLITSMEPAKYHDGELVPVGIRP